MDGAYDTRAVAIIQSDGMGDCESRTARPPWHFGRAFWIRWSGYHPRSRVAATLLWFTGKTLPGCGMRCLKACGARIMARDPDRQTAEIHIRIALMNRVSALGTAEIVRVD